MIEAKKLAYADLLRYIGDPRFSTLPVSELLSKTRAADRARRIDPARAQCAVEPAVLDGITSAQGHDTIYLTTIDRDGNMVSLIQSNYSGFGSGLVPDGAGFMLQNRGALFTLEPNQPNTLAPRKRPLHTIIPGFMEKNGTRIAFGIMGGWNQAQAHAQFVADIADFALTPQEALEAGRFTKRYVHRLRRADRSTRARSHAQRADGARPPAEGRAPARQPVRLGPGHPRAYRRRPFRRLGAPTRWDGASGRAGRVQVIPSASGFRLRGSGRVCSTRSGGNPRT